MPRNIDNSRVFQGHSEQRLGKLIGLKVPRSADKHVKTQQWGLESTAKHLEAKEQFYEASRQEIARLATEQVADTQLQSHEF